MAKLNNNFIKSAGEHFVCAELARMRIISSITSNNAPFVDIIATKDGTKAVSVQVKASQGRNNPHTWDVGTKRPNISESFFWVFVNVWEDETQRPEYYIMQAKFIADSVNWNNARPTFNLKKDQIQRFENNWKIIKDYLGA